jgi:DNA-binding GntR family transcriptional regulator
MEIKRDCMRGYIRRALVERILNGTYRPGDRLIELQLAREFKTSQGPVREALRELEALRLVENETFRGTRVRAISDQEARDAGRVRGLLEEEAARVAAPRMTGQTGPLREALEGLRRAAAAQDLNAYARHNMAFHRVIVEASGNAVLLRLWDSMMLEVRTRINLSQQPHDLIAAAETHAPIVAALECGDGAAAGRLLREHAEMFLASTTAATSGSGAIGS